MVKTCTMADAFSGRRIYKTYNVMWVTDRYGFRCDSFSLKVTFH
jgi:hypothetical protein